jgi:hypothetical protein
VRTVVVGVVDEVAPDPAPGPSGRA